MRLLRQAGPAALIWSAVVFPALLLGVLAVRSADEQRIILERKETELRQQQTDQLASQIRLALGGLFEEFSRGLDDQLGRIPAGELSADFTKNISSWWRNPGIGFAVTLDGRILSPPGDNFPKGSEADRFLAGNRSFFANAQEATVYQSVPTPRAELEKLQEYNTQEVASQQKKSDAASEQMDKGLNEKLYRSRAVVPQKQTRAQQEITANLSNVAPSYSRFGELVSSQTEGVLSRFVDDRLEVLFWKRPRNAPDMVFGIRFLADDLRLLLESATAIKPDSSVRFAVLNERGMPMLVLPSGFKADWKNPFVATEIGEVLPRWEAALYLADPGQLDRTARSARFASTGLVLLALACMGLGMVFIALRTRQQTLLARKKTDFVSNVSHELKTPLTSIRMFAELLEEQRISDPAKTAHYLRIIRQESERLTRLINNVLDFAKMDRGEKSYHYKPVNLGALLDDIWEGQQPHLENEGFTLLREPGPGESWVWADSDALSQVVVNLLSNAEKYSPEGGVREIVLKNGQDHNGLFVEISDRGLGVPRGHERKIFERFHRAHDSLSSGIQGAGLGLTLAQRIIEDHGGTLTYCPRSGGGSTFRFTLPTFPDPVPSP